MLGRFKLSKWLFQNQSMWLKWEKSNFTVQIFLIGKIKVCRYEPYSHLKSKSNK